MHDDRPSPGDEARQDAVLKRLLAAALAPDLEASKRPSAASIRAYLVGHATGDQEAEIRRAMLYSRTFAEEMLEYLRAGQDLRDPGLKRRLDAVQVPLTDLIASAKRALRPSDARSSGIGEPAGGRRETEPVGARPNGAGGWWQRTGATLMDWLWRPGVGYALATAAVLGFVLLPHPAGDGKKASPIPGLPVELVMLATERSDRGIGSNAFQAVPAQVDGAQTELVVEQPVDPSHVLWFETTLDRIGPLGDVQPLVYLAENRRFRPVRADLAYPALLVDASLLVPGRYELTFVPVSADSTRLDDLTCRSRFAVSAR
ncbi:MAG TPA: hypothetical protein PLL30_14400 [Candidatus Krumholzibacteria bacterium]|nr:hypothetical protein [Candidatus Krumholzibacteria bacterium]HPD72958.1 hypothetical protein [Candidatus Krumholzibacteria bacterium]HRY41757.1 hypothetical protein [Candidatus Krumholzibacteria bacterium]